MSNTYLTTPIALDEFRHWKWLQTNNMRISYDENVRAGWFDETFTLWLRESGDKLYDTKSITVYVKSNYVIGFRVGGDPDNYKVIDLIVKQFKNEVESVNYMLERYTEL